MVFNEIRKVRPERSSVVGDYVIHAEDKHGPAGVYFQTIDDLKQFMAAANTLIERETAPTRGGEVRGMISTTSAGRVFAALGEAKREMLQIRDEKPEWSVVASETARHIHQAIEELSCLWLAIDREE